MIYVLKHHDNGEILLAFRKDNCATDVKVDISVTSNELYNSATSCTTMAKITERQESGSVEQAEFLFSPTR